MSSYEPDGPQYLRRRKHKRPTTRPMPPDHRRCVALVKAGKNVGRRCSNPAVKGSDDQRCLAHSGVLQAAAAHAVYDRRADQVATALVRQEDREAYAEHRRAEAKPVDEEVERILAERARPSRPKTEQEMADVRAAIKIDYPSALTASDQQATIIADWIRSKQNDNEIARASWAAAYASGIGIRYDDIPPPPRLVLPFDYLEGVDPMKAAAACISLGGGLLPTFARAQDINERWAEAQEARDDLVTFKMPFPRAGYAPESPYAPQSKTRFYGPLDPRARAAAREVARSPGYTSPNNHPS